MRGIVPPTVPDGGERVRICLHAGNTKEEIEGLVEVVRRWARDQQPQRISELQHVPQRARL